MSRTFWTRTAAVIGLLLLTGPAAPAFAQEAEGSVQAESTGGGELRAQAVTATVNGSGATFISNIMQAWTSEFKKREPRATVNYGGGGSTTGRRSFCDGTTDFGGSDTPFPRKADEDACMAKRPFVYLPITAGGVSIFYNLPGNPNVKLSGSTIARIFSGRITNWNDPAITADNGSALPNLAIETVVRQEGSGTSNVFTSYMKAASDGNWAPAPGDAFPQRDAFTGARSDFVQVRATGSSNVANEVKNKAGRIGYAETSFPKNLQPPLPSASVRNGSGGFVQPTANNVSEAIGDGTIREDGTVVLNYTTANPTAYPISTVSYLLAPTSLPGDKGDTLKAFLNYANSAEAQALAAPNDYAPTPQKLRDNNAKQIGRINAASASPQTTQLQTGTVDSAPAPAAAPVAASPESAPAAAPATATTLRPSVAGAGANRGARASTTAAAPAGAAPATMARTGGEHIALALAGVALLLLGLAGQRRLRAGS